jgi:ABC-type uncharacterized transport system ATPase subunit
MFLLARRTNARDAMETHPDGGRPPPLLQVDGVTLAFGGVKALTGVSFDVQPARSRP